MSLYVEVFIFFNSIDKLVLLNNVIYYLYYTLFYAFKKQDFVSDKD